MLPNSQSLYKKLLINNQVVYVLAESISKLKRRNPVRRFKLGLNLTPPYLFFFLAGQRFMSKILLVLATHNRGKKREYELSLKELPIEIKGLSEFRRIPEFEEEGSSFKEIAIKKAQFASRILDVPALADDSGLEVDCLNGAPGILSARYSGKSANDYQNNRKLLEEMSGQKNRGATFVCSIAIAKPSGQVLTYTGRCSGIILNEPAGTNGFGYDPLFFYPPLNKTFAQLSVKEKNRISHRGQAIRILKDDFMKALIWLEDT